MSQERARPRPPASVSAFTVLAFLVLYVPLAALVVSSFQSPEGLTLDWYRRAFSNTQVLDALGMSLKVGIGSTLLSTLLGTAAALAFRIPSFPGRKLFDLLTHVNLVLPEIVLGLSLLVWFVFLNLTLGLLSMTLAHVTFSLSYVIITVRARLEGFDVSLEEAARDLGATPWKTFRYVTLPLIWPGILAGALMAFTLSFDDFLVTFFTAGVGQDTLPLKIYAMIKFGVTPEINALSTVLLVGTFILAGLSGFSGRSSESLS